MSADLAGVLQEARAIVAEQQERLRTLAASVRSNTEAAGVALRQAERQLDEAAMQHRSAVDRRAANTALAGRRHSEARTRYEALEAELRSNQHALKQIEQLIRQIEMSSAALAGAEETGNDPWMLALRAQVIHGREEERVRLAREVHDGPAQVLANSLMILETCYTIAQQTNHEKLLLMLDRMRKATKEGLHDVRRFIADLRPGRIEEQGLNAAIAEYIRGYVNAHDARVQLDSEPLPTLPIETAIVLYRIVQESLQNAHKYARGAPISVRITRQHDALMLVIRDEGPGFDVHEVARRAGRSSWGLTSMRERAEMIGARFTVTSRPGYGTDVTVALPLDGQG